MMRKPEMPLIETNYAGIARELSGNLSSQAELLRQIQVKCLSAMQAQREPLGPMATASAPDPANVMLPPPAEYAANVQYTAGALDAMAMSGPPSLRGKPPPSCPESPISWPSRQRPGRTWAWEA